MNSEEECEFMRILGRWLSEASMVPRTGIEPVRGFPLRILSPVRLPIPPPGRVLHAVRNALGPGPVIKVNSRESNAPGHNTH